MVRRPSIPDIAPSTPAAWKSGARIPPPTLRELQQTTGFSSLSVVEYWLDECEKAGLLRHPRNIARAFTLTAAGRPFAEAH